MCVYIYIYKLPEIISITFDFVLKRPAQGLIYSCTAACEAALLLPLSFQQ